MGCTASLGLQPGDYILQRFVFCGLFNSFSWIFSSLFTFQNRLPFMASISVVTGFLRLTVKTDSANAYYSVSPMHFWHNNQHSGYIDETQSGRSKKDFNVLNWFTDPFLSVFFKIPIVECWSLLQICSLTFIKYNIHQRKHI